MQKRRSFALMGGFAVVMGLTLGQPISAASTSPPPDPGVQRLVDVVEVFSLELGISTDASSILASAGLSSGEATALAVVLESLLECHDLTDAVASDAMRIWAEDGSPEEITWEDSMEGCGKQATLELEALDQILETLPAATQGCSPVTVWPVLFYERCGDDTEYLHDYVLLVDRAGDDTYFNNAGSNVIDLMRGPASPPALVAAPARGCQTDAELNRGSGNCFLTAAALLDQRGNDTYQRRQTPEVDSECTSDPIVRRLATGGSGVAGVGILLDQRQDDAYLGKTLALGMGHAGGYGLLRDREGNDSYGAIRSSIGAGVLVGFGELEDGGGSDVYDPYDPAGGVIDNTGVCRAGNANLFGAGLIAASGFFRERGGSDVYEASGVANGLGSGDLGGFGLFRDEDGADVYNGATGGRDNSVCFPTQNGTGAGHFCDVP